jgi:hypothetical protein
MSFFGVKFEENGSNFDMEQFIGRQEELETLGNLLKKKSKLFT